MVLKALLTFVVHWYADFAFYYGAGADSFDLAFSPVVYGEVWHLAYPFHQSHANENFSFQAKARYYDDNRKSRPSVQ